MAGPVVLLARNRAILNIAISTLLIGVLSAMITETIVANILITNTLMVLPIKPLTIYGAVFDLFTA